ncbi:MAG: T9SS type A sorting domain-containing protein [Bacteroidetes bacterium]|nr:T9SS type A sorting domain-containing protein [Bacteroidota bacterium]
MKNPLKSLLALAMCITSTQYSIGQIPVLNSNPSAAPVIYLDFDGQYLDGTAWNYNGPMTCAPADVTNEQINLIFNRVAEDYRPFTVNITTELAKFLAAPLNRRMRVILTTTWEWYSAVGGTSLPGTFNDGDDTPCFVFTSLFSGGLANLTGRPKNIAEAVSHEVGHTLGLYHQAAYDANCVKITDYNGGAGGGEIGWAPIMGVGYYQNLTVWHNGPNPYGCTNYQSDMELITTTDPFATNGISFRTDDHSNAYASATSLTFTNGLFTTSGVVERNTDMDVFRFTMATTGRFLLNGNPYNVGLYNAGSNLDMQVTIYNADQSVSRVYNPGTLLSSVIDTTLTAGTYYLKVEGRGNAYAPNYASLGSYVLQGQNNFGNPLPLRVLKLNGLVNGDKHQFNWVIDADEQVTRTILEISTDGINFRPVTEPGNSDRAFIYRPNVSSNAQYRLNVTFDNGKQYYSNIITLRKTGNTQRPQLVSNLVENGVVGVTSPGNFGYMIYDLNGKTIRKGQLTNGYNTINTAGVTGGMYMIRYTGSTEQWTDKLILQ